MRAIKPHPPRPRLLIHRAQEECHARGWKYVKLDDKPLHGLQNETPKTITEARRALDEWGTRQAAQNW